MSGRDWTAVSAALLIGLVFTARNAGALSTPNQFCTGNPCIISGQKAADPDIVLDFGPRSVILQGTLTLTPRPTGDVGGLTIQAASFTISGNGQIRGFSSSFSGGSVTVNAVDTIQINNTVGSGAVRVSGQDGGELTLTTMTGPINVAGRLTLYGDGIPASGGTLTIVAATHLTVTGEIDNYGGLQGIGGDVDLSAGGNIITGPIDLSGGDIGGGFLDVTAAGSVTFGEIDLSGSGLGGDAGFATIDAGGNIRFHERFRGRGADNGEDCGDGADVDVTAAGEITVASEMDIRGRGLDCSGGTLALDGARVFVQAPILMSATGPQGTGGDLDILSTLLTRISAPIELDGGDGGGDVLLISDAELEIFGSILANGRTAVGSGAALLDITAGKITLSGTIDGSAGSATAAGPAIFITACDVLTNPSAAIRALGDAGSIAIEARDTFKLRGQFQAASNGGISMHYSTQAAPPDTAGASFSPAPTHILDPSLMPCRVCQEDADCADSDPCTDDICNVTACLNTLREGKPCSDGDPCTIGDACVAGVCQSGPMGTCDDIDGDGKVDDADECTTINWTPEPTKPPNQNPLRFLMNVKRLSAGESEIRFLMKGLFAVAASQPLGIDPAANGVHLYVEDSVGPILDVSLPGGTGCVPEDGWTTLGVGFRQTWRYRNETNSVPPMCSNGSAHGIQSLQIKDKRLTNQAGLQFKLKASNATILRDVVLPLTRVQVSLSLAAQSFPGVATAQAKAGQCAEALFTGNPISACRTKFKDGVLDGIICKGK